MCSIHPVGDARDVGDIGDVVGHDDAAWLAITEQAEAEWAPSPWQRFAHLFTLEPHELSDPQWQPADTELVRRMRDCEALVTQLLAEQGRALLELRRRRLVDQAAAHPHVDGVCTGACCDDDGWVALEVALELGLSERQVTSRLDTALRMRRHQAVEAAMDDGLLQSWTATTLLEHLDALSTWVTPQRLAQVEAATLAWLLASPRTVAQLNNRMRRLILAARDAADDSQPDSRDPDSPDPHSPDQDSPHPDVPDPTASHPEHQRRVSVLPSATPGLAELVARLPESDALAVRATLLALGHDPVHADDRRSADQRRADLLVTLVTGSPARHGHPEDARCALREPVDVAVRLDVTVPADTLRGGPAPALIPGYGDIPATTARDVSALNQHSRPHAPGRAVGQARPLVYDPASGRLLGFGATPVPITWLDGLPTGAGYQHPATLDTAIRLRDGTCRAPGCRRRARRCDCDHVVAYPQGETSLANSCCLCRRHHRLKTHAPGWSVSGHGDALQWRTPTGRTVTTQPHDYRPDVAPDPTPHHVADPPPDPLPDPPPF